MGNLTNRAHEEGLHKGDYRPYCAICRRSLDLARRWASTEKMDFPDGPDVIEPVELLRRYFRHAEMMSRS